MNCKKWVSHFGVLLLTASLVTFSGGCVKENSAKPDSLKVGIVIYDQSDIFLSELLSLFREDMEELQKKETDLEISVMVRDADNSQRNEDKQVEELLDDGCNILCINLVDRTIPGTIINMAMKKEVPILFFNKEPVREDLFQWEDLYYIGTDTAQSGQMQGELAADAIGENATADRNKDGKIQYVILQGEPGHQDSIIRTENVVNTLMERGINLEKLDYQIANWDRAQGMNKMMQMIEKYGNKIELVLSNNDSMALGAIDAYKKLNITESSLPLFFGVDGTKDGLQAVKDQTLSATVYNDKEGQASNMAKLSVAIFKGQNLDDFHLKDGKYIFLPYQKVTQENVQEFQ